VAIGVDDLDGTLARLAERGPANVGIFYWTSANVARA
jgi:hypothetical protein